MLEGQTPMLPPKDKERNFYYAGLPSRPRLIARSSAFVWEEPKAWRRSEEEKKLSNVGDHPIAYVIDKITPDVIDTSVSWTSIDVVRIGYEALPLVLWMSPHRLFPVKAVSCKQQESPAQVRHRRCQL